MPFDAVHSDAGIIPAYAGNTQIHAPLPIDRRDHPRVCGEHTGRGTANRARPGSSPRMRGTLQRGRVDERGRGIIPAYAGNTRRRTRAAPIVRDHPRVCGEHFHEVAARAGHLDHPRVCGEHALAAGDDTAYEGSSPRMRGTRQLRAGRRLHRGIIPAYAGNTFRRSAMFLYAGDHPRVCGEHTKRL